MSATASILAVLLALAVPTPAPTTAECALTDNRCKATRYEQRAAAAPTPGQRALYLHSAYRSYLFLFEKTGDMRDLCAARRTFDASLAVDGLPEPQRARFAADRDELVAHERQHDPRCGSTARRRARKPDPTPPQEPPPSAVAGPAIPAESGAAELGPPSDRPPLLLETPQPSGEELMPVSASRVKHMRPADASRPGPTREARPGRALVIAGGTTLGVGVALAAGTGHMGNLMSEKRTEIRDLKGRTEPFATPTQHAKDQALRGEYHAMRSQTVALAVASGMTVIVAAILVSVGGRRMARAASRTALLPAPGGLVFHGRF